VARQKDNESDQVSRGEFLRVLSCFVSVVMLIVNYRSAHFNIVCTVHCARWQVNCQRFNYLKAVVSPRSELEQTELFVERKVGDVDFARAQ